MAPSQLREDYKLGSISDYASLIFVRVISSSSAMSDAEDGEQKKDRGHIPVGFVFVIDRRKFGDRAKYKLPAGHFKKEEDRSPLHTASRELRGETGINVPFEHFEYAGKWLGPRNDHWKMLFVATITEDERDWMNNRDRENEGEQPAFFTVKEFFQLVRENKFMLEHYDMLVACGLILPLGRDQTQKQVVDA